MPIIFGSVTHGWEHKLKMIYPRFFSLLSICENLDIVQDASNSNYFKKGVIDLLQTTDTGYLFNIREQLNGYHHILDHMLFHNDYYDVHVINAPEDLANAQPRDQHFVYCEYLPPGHH